MMNHTLLKLKSLNMIQSMNLRFMLTLLVSTVLASNVVAKENVFTIRGKVKDANGKGVAGVVVYDRQNFTRTDVRGNWTLRTDTFVSKFIAISTPAAYQLPAKKGLAAGFYVPIREAIRKKGHNFILQKRKKANDNFYFIAISDPQVRDRHDMNRWKRETVPDLLQTVDSLKKQREVVGMTLGDLVFDSMNLYGEFASSMQNMGMTMFQCIGNHDFDKRYKDLHNMPLGSPVYGEMVFNRYFGPTDYSFNIGKVHVVTMKNINYMGNKKYVEALTDQQLAWLEKDLSFVPKGSVVILNMHAAGWNKVGGVGNVRNADKLAAVLKPYRAHVFCGHTHFFQNVEVAPNLYQHNLGAACGAWWTGWINLCGTPNGYMIVDVNGNDLTWNYRSTGFPNSHQMKLYDKGEFRSEPDYVVANVWDVDEKNTVEWYQDGKAMGRMEQFTDVDEQYASRFVKAPAVAKTAHLFRCEPAEGYKEIKVVVKNRFGKTVSDVIRSHIKIVAHRGGSGLYPENTIEAMQNAVGIGAKNLEVDLQITKDSAVVVSHDPHVIGYERQYPIFSMKLKDLQKLTIGDKKDDRFPNSKRLKSHIPTITELIDSVETYCHDHHLEPVNYTVEIKSNPDVDGKLSPDYKTFDDLCMKALNSRYLGSRLIIQSFDIRTLKYIHQKYPNVRIHYLVGQSAGTFWNAIERLGFMPEAITPEHKMVTPDFVAAAKKAGVKVIVWTVNSEADAKRMVESGVNAIITDYPDKMAQWIKK